jgi:hypothetical protein
MTIAEFKSLVKVGNYLIGYSTKISAKVTAIGEKRFLYINHHGREAVSKIENYQACWELAFEVPCEKIDIQC